MSEAGFLGDPQGRRTCAACEKPFTTDRDWDDVFGVWWYGSVGAVVSLPGVRRE